MTKKKYFVFVFFPKKVLILYLLFLLCVIMQFSLYKNEIANFIHRYYFPKGIYFILLIHFLLHVFSPASWFGRLNYIVQYMLGGDSTARPEIQR